MSCSGSATQSIVGKSRAAGRAGDVPRLPAEHLFDEGPGIAQARAWLDPSSMSSATAALSTWRLPRGREAKLLEQGRRDDEADRLDMVQPFEIGIAIDLCGHGAQPDAGQR